MLIVQNNHILYSNRSAAYIALKQNEEALKDAQKCVNIDPKWPKGYLRLGHALMELNQFKQATEALKDSLKVNEEENQAQNKKHQISLKPLLKHVLMKEIEFENEKLFNQLKGRWHGKLSENVGGYWQEFNFKSTTSVMVSLSRN